jgi:AcrR family transcriptional regulator
VKLAEADLERPLEKYYRTVTSATKAAVSKETVADDSAAAGLGSTPLRADAERNRLRIMQAAAKVFAERGLDGTLHDVAKAAGLGVGTVYRRFPDKEALIEALFETEIDRIADLAEQAGAQPDAWVALMGFLRGMCGEQADNRGLHEVLNSTDYGQHRVAAARDRIMPIIAGMLERAQEQGRARSDIEPSDLGMLMMMVSSLAHIQEARSDAWVRYFELMMDALGARPGQSVLTVPALTGAELDSAMGNFKRKG